MTTSTAVTKLKDTTDVTTVFDDGANPFLNRTTAEGVNEGLFGRFNGNNGEFMFGEDQTIPAGEVVICDLFHAKLGWLGFDPDNKPIKGPEVSFVSGDALSDHESTPGVRWMKQLIFEMTLIDGRSFIYSAKADKPSRPAWKLMQAYGKAIPRKRDDNRVPMIPVVEVGSAPFQMEIEEDRGGVKCKVKVTKYKEVFNIVDWNTVAEVADIKAGGTDRKSVV